MAILARNMTKEEMLPVPVYDDMTIPVRFGHYCVIFMHLYITILF